jgi:hypothetical protein
MELKMARLPRLNLPGIPQHVVQRGKNRWGQKIVGVSVIDNMKESLGSGIVGVSVIDNMK